MFSIGKMSLQTGVKIPTIRYYEEIGLLAEPGRNSGNQRRYSQADLEQLSFIKHARDLGLNINAVQDLLRLHNHPDQSCADAHVIANTHLDDVRSRLKQLRKLEKELKRITNHAHDGHTHSDNAKDCTIIRTLADHQLCLGDH